MLELILLNTAAVVGASALVSALLTVRGTTLVMPCLWALAGLGVLTIVESYLLFAETGAWWIEPVRFVAAVGTFSPLVALLGAKRPQDRPWVFIVLSLWAMLVLPSLEVLFLQPGQLMEVHGARPWFLIILVSLSLIVGVPTGMRFAAILFAGGQWLLLASFLPRILASSWHSPRWTGILAMTLFGGAAILGRWQLTRRLNRASTSAASPSSDSSEMDTETLPGFDSISIDKLAGWTRVWLDFRDWYGLLWALRVSERVNAVAESQRWPVRLQWQGFVAHPPQLREPLNDEGPREARQESENVGRLEDTLALDLEALRRVMWNLLRRFVDQKWIDTRLTGRSPNSSNRLN